MEFIFLIKKKNSNISHQRRRGTSLHNKSPHNSFVMSSSVLVYCEMTRAVACVWQGFLMIIRAWVFANILSINQVFSAVFWVCHRILPCTCAFASVPNRWEEAPAPTLSFASEPNRWEEAPTPTLSEIGSLSLGHAGNVQGGSPGTFPSWGQTRGQHLDPHVRKSEPAAAKTQTLNHANAVC